MCESFIFYRSFFEALSTLNDTDRLAAYDAICKYALDGEISQIDGVAFGMFKLISPQIDANARRRENGKKGAEHGKLGGRPRAENPIGVSSNNPLGVSDENPKQTPNVNVNVNENDNVNVNVNEKGVQGEKHKKKNACRIPPDWECSSALGQWAMEQGLARAEVIAEIDNFTDHWTAASGSSARKHDWDAAFRTWIRNSAKWKKK